MINNRLTILFSLIMCVNLTAAQDNIIDLKEASNRNEDAKVAELLKIKNDLTSQEEQAAVCKSQQCSRDWATFKRTALALVVVCAAIGMTRDIQY